MSTSPIAIVRPRVRVVGSHDADPTLLVELVAARLASGARGSIRLTGPRGSGRTTALAVLREEFAGADELVLLDLASQKRVEEARRVHFVLWTPPPGDVERARDDETWMLEPWGKDELIEYLLATHPAQCASVLARVERTPGWLDLEGNALLWSRVLDRMAREPNVSDGLAALEELLAELERTAPCFSDYRRVAAQPSARVRECGPFFSHLGEGVERPRELTAWFARRCVRLVAGAWEIARAIEDGRGRALLCTGLDADDHAAVERALERDERTLELLIELATTAGEPSAATGLGLLHALDASRARAVLGSRRGRERSAWPGTRLPGAVAPRRVRRIDLDGALLARSTWTDTRVSDASFVSADLRLAQLEGARWLRVDGTRAALYGARASRWSCFAVSFHGASLHSADLSDGRFHLCWFELADLRKVRCARARFERCDFEGALLAEADLGHARFHRARLDRADLRAARLDGASLRECWLERANLENVSAAELELSGSTLAGALLTASHLPRVVLTGANLRRAGLAGVDWEDADLRGADLRHAVFHLGSTRSGLLVGAPPSWGTRTGYYTADEKDHERLPPEVIRKANLQRADLRGAHVLECDFYLVDLRGAAFTHEQGQHFRKCGAILDHRPV